MNVESLVEGAKAKVLHAVGAVTIAGMGAWGGSALDGDVPANQVDQQVNQRVYAIETRLGSIETSIEGIETRLTNLEKIEREDFRDLYNKIDELKNAVLSR